MSNIVSGSYLKIVFFICLFCLARPSFSGTQKKDPSPDDTTRTAAGVPGSQLDKDEGIKCTRAELLAWEFTVKCNEKYGEILRITYQDLERGGREIIFQKKMVLNDEVKFYIPMNLIQEAKTAVLIVMKGSGMFYKKLDITD